jgi:hypothetical protein
MLLGTGLTSLLAILGAYLLLFRGPTTARNGVR